MDKHRMHIVWFSPAGTTRKVAETIAEQAKALGKDVYTLDLWGANDSLPNLDLQPGDSLVIGSPVYVQHPVPLVKDFIKNLSLPEGISAAAFVTYGTVTSGTALEEMAEALVEKGATVIGGMIVPAMHSMLRNSQSPLGPGRPDSGDLDSVKKFTSEIVTRSRNPHDHALSPDLFKQDNPRIRDAAAESGLEKLKAMLPPWELEESLCTECGVCLENCPVGNITLDPVPQFQDRCILCLNCIVTCEPQAIKSQVLPMLEQEIHKRKEVYGQKEEIRLFLQLSNFAMYF